MTPKFGRHGRGGSYQRPPWERQEREHTITLGLRTVPDRPSAEAARILDRFLSDDVTMFNKLCGVLEWSTQYFNAADAAAHMLRERHGIDVKPEDLISYVNGFSDKVKVDILRRFEREHREKKGARRLPEYKPVQAPAEPPATSPIPPPAPQPTPEQPPAAESKPEPTIISVPAAPVQQQAITPLKPAAETAPPVTATRQARQRKPKPEPPSTEELQQKELAETIVLRLYNIDLLRPFILKNGTAALYELASRMTGIPAAVIEKHAGVKLKDVTRLWIKERMMFHRSKVPSMEGRAMVQFISSDLKNAIDADVIEQHVLELSNTRLTEEMQHMFEVDGKWKKPVHVIVAEKAAKLTDTTLETLASDERIEIKPLLDKLDELEEEGLI